MSVFFATQADQSLTFLVSQKQAGNAPVLPFRGMEITRSNQFVAGTATMGADVDITQTAGTGLRFYLGVTDGSIESFNSTNAANIGDPISFQVGNAVQVSIMESVVAGDTLYLHRNNAGQFATTYEPSILVPNPTPPPAFLQPIYWQEERVFVALQSGSANELIWAYRISAFMNTYEMDPHTLPDGA